MAFVRTPATSCLAQDTPPSRTYRPEALRADIDHLRRALLRRHPDPFRYTTRERMDRCFDSLSASATGPMTELRFLSHIAAVYPMLADGHTLFLPGPGTSDQHREARFLPILPYWTGGHLYVRANGSPSPQVRPGAEILAINGVPSAAIMDTLMRRQIRDGANTTYPEWILNNYFRAYYRFSFGEPDTFDVALQDGHARTHVRMASLPADRIDANRRRHGPHGGGVEVRPGYGLEVDTAAAWAILTIPSFAELGPGLERFSACRRRLRADLERIRTSGVQRLLLDLRGNQGGRPALAKELLAHLLKEPFHLVWKGPSRGPRRPVDHPFEGPMVVLMDGGSFSVTGMVLSCLERHQRATFIGVEAGGNRTVLSGSPRRVVLPNTGIHCHISSRNWRLADRPNDGHGVMPTLEVVPGINDLLSGDDPVLNAGLRALH